MYVYSKVRNPRGRRTCRDEFVLLPNEPESRTLAASAHLPISLLSPFLLFSPLHLYLAYSSRFTNKRVFLYVYVCPCCISLYILSLLCCLADECFTITEFLCLVFSALSIRKTVFFDAALYFEENRYSAIFNPSSYIPKFGNVTEICEFISHLRTSSSV